MRALPEAMREEIGDALDESGRAIAAAMVERTPTRTGALRKGIKHRVLRRQMKLRVGMIDAPKARNKLFYGRILDLGRKAQTVTVSRYVGGGASGSPRRRVKYLMRVRAIAPKRFVTGRYPDLRNALNEKLRGIWDRALRRISGGGDE